MVFLLFFVFFGCAFFSAFLFCTNSWCPSVVLFLYFSFFYVFLHFFIFLIFHFFIFSIFVLFCFVRFLDLYFCIFVFLYFCIFVLFVLLYSVIWLDRPYELPWKKSGVCSSKNGWVMITYGLMYFFTFVICSEYLYERTCKIWSL